MKTSLRGTTNTFNYCRLLRTKKIVKNIIKTGITQLPRRNMTDISTVSSRLLTGAVEVFLSGVRPWRHRERRDTQRRVCWSAGLIKNQGGAARLVQSLARISHHFEQRIFIKEDGLIKLRQGTQQNRTG